MYTYRCSRYENGRDVMRDGRRSVIRRLGVCRLKPLQRELSLILIFHFGGRGLLKHEPERGTLCPSRRHFEIYLYFEIHLYFEMSTPPSCCVDEFNDERILCGDSCGRKRVFEYANHAPCRA